MAEIAKPVYEDLSLSDGTTLKVTKPPNMGPEDWAEAKDYLMSNPEEARKMESQNRDAKAMRDTMMTEALQNVYESKVAYGEQAFMQKLSGLEKNPDFAMVFDDIKKGGVAAAMQHYWNEPLMQKLNRAMGGIPEEAKESLVTIQKTPVTIHDACKMGDLKTVESFLAGPGNWDIDDKDSKGITCLGYAVGANRPQIIKVLMDKKADPAAVDTSGNSALHYAAAYGRIELVKHFAKTLKVDAVNTSGQTALALAQKNKMTEAADILKK